MSRTHKPFTPRYSQEELAAAIAAKGAFLQKFYEAIKESWDYYIEYRWLSDRHQFVMPRTEINAMETLFDLADGEPYIAEKLIAYCTGMGWSGIYLPKDHQLMSKWKRETEEMRVEVLDIHKQLAGNTSSLIYSTFPAEASAEAIQSYQHYLSETKAWWGNMKPGSYLSTADFGYWCRQEGEFDAGINPADKASLFLMRIKIHDAFVKSGHTNARYFFIKYIQNHVK